MAFRIGIAVVALVALLALFICQYRLSDRLSRREAALGRPEGEGGGTQSSDVANWN
ncbi:hypothetical protein [Cupriavidus pauculus]|uniref:hypothetical protein n=1 Tax=Cupriavidus pauculus TaxID=82633 RepID=UPI001EE1F601|nr:hypothetical protein [Cupriavidus pauculus]GJG94827.1 hypothetical protein CBA19C6_10080 [Cupriavidus pauculus]